MPGAGEVRVQGLKELQTAFRRVSDGLRVELDAELKVVGEAVRFDAERLARGSISHIGSKWSEMRVGVAPGLVYVAPKKRGIKSGPRKRPNLAGLLMDKALQPALEQNEDAIEARLEFMLDRLGRESGF